MKCRGCSTLWWTPRRGHYYTSSFLPSATPSRSAFASRATLRRSVLILPRRLSFPLSLLPGTRFPLLSSLFAPLFAHSSVPTPHVVLHICQVIRKLYQRKSMRIVTYLDEHGTDLLRRAFVLPTCVILLLAALPHARLPTPSDTQRPRLTSRISRLLAYPRGAPLSGWCRLRPTVA